MLKLEIPIDLTRPFSTSFSISLQVGMTLSARATSSLILPLSALTAWSNVGTVPLGASTWKLICRLDGYHIAQNKTKNQEKKTTTYVPVQQVQVKVLDTQVLQSVLTSKFNVLGVVVELKELGGNVDFLSRDAGSLETLTDFLLVTIGPGTAKDWRNGSVRGYDAV